jgi:hypothetical protein
MRKNIIILLSFCTSISFAQGLTNFDYIKLENATDCRAADPYALEASNYLFSTPFQKDDINRLKSLQFIIKWMTATPDYQFSLDEVAGKLLKGSDDLLGLYMGAMTKYVLENKNSAGDAKLVKLNAITILLNYSDNPANNVKPTKNLKKLSEAKAKGQLEQALETEK